MMRATIDIGSNTFRLLIANANDSGTWETEYYTHRIVRLGEGLHRSGRLSAAGMARAITAMQEFSAIIKQHGLTPDSTYAVATAAMREAENGPELQQHIRTETGIDIHIIDGDTEAELSLAGAAAVVDVKKRQDMLLFDIGGGSTEFVRARHARVNDAISRKLGVVRLVETHLHSDPPSTADYNAMLTSADEHLAAVEMHWGDDRIPEYLVGTAGTVTTLAAVHLNLHPYVVEKINNHVISKIAFTQLRDRLLAMSLAKRQTLPSIEQGRADLMVAGLAIIEAIFKRWNYPEMTIVDAGLLEGVWLCNLRGDL
ncbi:MAG: Ppx/GppA phosphatase family protein [Mariprofundaceae bacterium]|nr:Ppx/GppA phosphatase family protein [Mariprofundaceae bacterium]